MDFTSCDSLAVSKSFACRLLTLNRLSQTGELIVRTLFNLATMTNRQGNRPFNIKCLTDWISASNVVRCNWSQILNTLAFYFLGQINRASVLLDMYFLATNKSIARREAHWNKIQLHALNWAFWLRLPLKLAMRIQICLLLREFTLKWTYVGHVSSVFWKSN